MIALVLSAQAISPDSLRTRVAEVAPLRSLRNTPNAPPIPLGAYDEVAAGQVATGVVNTPGQKHRKIYGVGIVDVPIGRFFSAINDEKNKPDYTTLEHIVLLDGDYCGAERIVFQVLPVPIVSDRWWITRQSINTALQQKSSGRVREMSWRPEPAGKQHMTPLTLALASKGVEVTMTHGGWFLIDLGEGQTLVEFWSWSDPGSGVPAGMAASFAARSIEDTLGTMTELAQKGPACKL